MNRKLITQALSSKGKKVPTIKPDIKIGPPRTVRLLLDDDKAIAKLDGTISKHVATLVNKGPLYEQLEAGNQNLVFARLLKQMSSVANKRVEQALNPLLAEFIVMRQLLSTLFLTITRDITFPESEIDPSDLAIALEAVGDNASAMFEMLIVQSPQQSTPHTLPSSDPLTD
jgi:hypothetical protein